jgi:hypothetical protein
MNESATPAPEDSTIDKTTLGMIVASMGRRREKRGEEPAEAGEKSRGDRVRLVMHVDPLWLGRMQVQADRLGVSLSAYISQAATRRLERDEAEDPAIQKKRAAQKKRK